MQNGLLLLDKPIGITSHDLVNQARRWFKTRQVGHCGTLDPLASGLMILCIGWATRLSEYLLGRDKTYRAQIAFGSATDTYDAEGRVTSTSTALPNRAEIEQALPGFLGKISQVPPAFSAIKVNGKPAYQAARRGESTELAARIVEISKLEILDWQSGILTLEASCGSGTYIRSLAHDLGLALQIPAHLSSLRRTRIGDFTLSQAVTPTTAQENASVEKFEGWLLPAEQAVAHFPAVTTREMEHRRLCQGGFLPLLQGNLQGEVRLLAPDGSFFGIGWADSNLRQLRPHKIFV